MWKWKAFNYKKHGQEVISDKMNIWTDVKKMDGYFPEGELLS